MQWLAVVGATLIVVAIAGMGASGWGMHGPWMGPGQMAGGGMPHMVQGHHRGTGTAPAPVAGAPAVPVTAVDFGFRPKEIRVRAGQPVNLTVVNRGALEHDLTLPTLGIHAVARPGARTSVGIAAAKAGTYEFYCSVPGHREAGMVGRLVVAP